MPNCSHCGKPVVSATVTCDACQQSRDDDKARIETLQTWVADLQSGMYVNCVYCGHRYGPADQVPGSMAEALKQHIEQCPEHPASKLKAEIAHLTAERDAQKQRADEAIQALRDTGTCQGCYYAIEGEACPCPCSDEDGDCDDTCRWTDDPCSQCYRGDGWHEDLWTFDAPEED